MKKTATKPKPSPEPETLGPADVVGMTGAAPAAKPDPAASLGVLNHHATIGEIHAYIEAYKYQDVPVSTLTGQVFKSKGLAATKAVLERIKQEPTLELINVGVDTHVQIRAKKTDAQPAATQAPAANVAQSPAPAQEVGQPEVKTVGEHLADAVTSVGTVAKDVKETKAKSGNISTAPLPEAARPMSEAELHDAYHKALIKHTQRGQDLANSFFSLKSLETQQHAELEETRKAVKDRAKLLAEHNRNVPSIESVGQRTIFDGAAPDPQTSTAPTVAPAVNNPLGWGYSLPVDQTIKLADCGLTFDDLTQNITGNLPPTEKAQNITGAILEVKGSNYLARESSQDDTRWFLQPVVTRDEWQQLYENEFGRSVEGFDQNDEAKQQRQKGGDDCGRVVKVSRSKCVMGPESAGLVIVVTRAEAGKDDDDHAAPADQDAKERAAGDASEPPETENEQEAVAS